MFNEVRLLDCVAYGSEFGHEYRTDIVELRSGVERRNAEWQQPLGRYSVRYQNLGEDDHGVVVSAHHACMGSLIGFRLKDWSDYRAESEVVGTGTGAAQQYQLKKHYTWGSIARERAIKKPVQNTVTVFVDGTQTAATINYQTGQFTLNAAAGAVITWSGEFDVPVRFSDDRLSFSVDARSGGFILNGDVDLQEIRL